MPLTRQKLWAPPGENPTQEGKVPDHQDREARTEAEIEQQAAGLDEDPITSREALEEELMEEGRSEAGEHIP
jgi:hypothetical protein